VSALVWGLEWRIALSRKRDLALWVLSPLAMVVILGTGAVSSLTAAACYAALFTSCGALCTLLPMLKDAERGMTAKVLRGGVAPGAYLIGRAAAGASVSLAQLLPSVVAAALLLRASFMEVLLAVAALAITLWIVSLVAVLAGAVGRNRSEALGLTGVTLLLLLHMSGVFRVPPSGGLGASLEEASPFRALHESFVALVSGGSAHGGIAELAWGIGLAALLLALAPVLAQPLARDG
jgi:hypothetical protein